MLEQHTRKNNMCISSTKNNHLPLSLLLTTSLAPRRWPWEWGQVCF